MRKFTFSFKSLLVAAGLLLGSANAWGYVVPSGYEIKTVYIGTDNGDQTVAAESFESVSVVPASWTKNLNSISIETVEEVAKVDVGAEVTNKPTYVGGKTLRAYLREGTGDGNQWRYATYTMASAVSDGKLVFSADFWASGNVTNSQMKLEFLDDEDNLILTLAPYAYGTTQGNFGYAIGNEALQSIGTSNTLWKENYGYAINDLVIDFETGATNLTLDFTERASGKWKRARKDFSINIGTGKNIAKFRIGKKTLSSNNIYFYIDNIQLYSVGTSSSSHAYTINAKAGSTVIQELASGYCSKDDTYNATGLPYVIKYGGNFYYLSDGTVTNFGTQNYTMGDEDETKNIEYTLDADIVYFNDCGSATSTQVDASCSGGNNGAWNTTQTISGLSAGTYTISVRTVSKYGSYWRGEVFAINGQEVARNAPGAAGIHSFDVTVPNASAAITFWQTYIYTDYMDYILIKRKSDLPSTEKIVVSDAGYATYVSHYNLDFTSATTKAYKVSVASKGVATLTAVAKVPAMTPVLLYAEGGNGEGEDIAVTSDAVDAITGNNLVPGLNAEVATTDGDYTNMILNNVSGIGFYFANGQTVAANRAYLHIATTLAPKAVGDGVKALTIIFGDDTATGVDAPVAAEAEEDGVYYNLNGQQVTKDYKGIVIVNGKKFFNK